MQEDDTVFTTRPPTNVKEKRFLLGQRRNKSYHQKYYQELKSAFFSANPEGKDAINEEQWCNSSLRYFLRDGNMNMIDFKNYFKHMDANGIGIVSWDEFVSYVIAETSSTYSKKKGGGGPIVEKKKSNLSVTLNHHRDPIIQVLFSPWNKEYITLSRDSIKFWNHEPLSFKYDLDATGPFSSMCSFQNHQVLAICLSTRVLLFYSLQSYMRMPVSLSASPSSHNIRIMGRNESETMLHTLKKANIPLFNAPTCMTEAVFSQHSDYQVQLLVADDCGWIELFSLDMPKRRQGTDYSIQMLSRFEMHKGSIIQMISIPEISTYASGSSDGSVKFFYVINSVFNITRVFAEKKPIVSFSFLKSQSFLAITLSGQETFIWSTQPVHHVTKLDPNYNNSNLCSPFTSSTGENFLVTLSPKGEQRFYNDTSFLLRGSFEDQEQSEVGPTAIYFDSYHFSLLTCSKYPTLWTSGAEVKYLSSATHQNSIIGAFYSKDFDQVVSIDLKGVIMLWNYSNGQKDADKHLNSDNIVSSCIDDNGRRIFTLEKGNHLVVWNISSGGIISEQFIHDSQISIMKYFQSGRRHFLVCGGWSKNVIVLIETSPGEFAVIKKYYGHSSDVTSICFDSNSMNIITGSANGELFLWPIDEGILPRQNIVDNSASIESIVISSDIVFVGDSNGYLTICLLPMLDIEFSIRAHNLPLEYSLSSISVDYPNKKLITADTIGYVRVWLIKHNQEIDLSPIKILRCHEGGVIDTFFINNGTFFVTSGSDQCVRIWCTETMTKVGSFSSISNWVLSDLLSWDQMPVTDDPRITIDLNFENKSSKLKSVRSLKSSADLMKLLSSSRSVNSNTTHENALHSSPKKNEELFDWRKVTELMQAHLSGANDIDYDQLTINQPHESERKSISPGPSSLFVNTIDPSKELFNEIETLNRIDKRHVQPAKVPLFEQKLAMIKKPRPHSTFM